MGLFQHFIVSVSCQMLVFSGSCKTCHQELFVHLGSLTISWQQSIDKWIVRKSGKWPQTHAGSYFSVIGCTCMWSAFKGWGNALHKPLEHKQVHVFNTWGAMIFMVRGIWWKLVIWSCHGMINQSPAWHSFMFYSQLKGGLCWDRVLKGNSFFWSGPSLWFAPLIWECHFSFLLSCK